MFFAAAAAMAGVNCDADKVLPCWQRVLVDPTSTSLVDCLCAGLWLGFVVDGPAETVQGCCRPCAEIRPAIFSTAPAFNGLEVPSQLPEVHSIGQGSTLVNLVNQVGGGVGHTH